MRSAKICFEIGLVMVLALWPAACKDSDPKTPDGTGGSTGTGGVAPPAGTGGTPATGGSTGDAANSPDTTSTCNVPCLADIDRECVPSGACVEQATGPLNIAANRCYDNGVKILTDIALGVPSSTMKITHKKIDGSVCFTVEGTLQGTTMAAVTWKNAAGMPVATGTYNLSSMEANIMCGDQSFDAQATRGCGATRNLPRAPGGGGTPSSCTMGMCM